MKLFLNIFLSGEECEDQCVCHGFKYLSDEIVEDLCSLSKYNEQCPVTCQTCSTKKTTTEAPKTTVKATTVKQKPTTTKTTTVKATTVKPITAKPTTVETTTVKPTTIKPTIPKTSAPVDGCTYNSNCISFFLIIFSNFLMTFFESKTFNLSGIYCFVEKSWVVFANSASR